MSGSSNSLPYVSVRRPWGTLASFTGTVRLRAPSAVAMPDASCPPAFVRRASTFRRSRGLSVTGPSSADDKEVSDWERSTGVKSGEGEEEEALESRGRVWACTAAIAPQTMDESKGIEVNSIPHETQVCTRNRSRLAGGWLLLGSRWTFIVEEDRSD